MYAVCRSLLGIVNFSQVIGPKKQQKWAWLPPVQVVILKMVFWLPSPIIHRMYSNNFVITLKHEAVIVFTNIFISTQYVRLESMKNLRHVHTVGQLVNMRQKSYTFLYSVSKINYHRIILYFNYDDLLYLMLCWYHDFTIHENKNFIIT